MCAGLKAYGKFILIFAGLKKKLVAQGNKKANRALLPWIKSITNHLWFCCESCGGDAEVNNPCEIDVLLRCYINDL